MLQFNLIDCQESDDFFSGERSERSEAKLRRELTVFYKTSQPTRLSLVVMNRAVIYSVVSTL